MLKPLHPKARMLGRFHAQIKEPLLLVHHFLRTRPELIGTTRALFRLMSADFMGQTSFLHRSKHFMLLEYLTEQQAAEVCVCECIATL